MHLVRYNFYGSIFIRLAVVAYQNREIPTKFDFIAVQGVIVLIDPVVNRKPICDFLLVINTPCLNKKQAKLFLL